MHTCISVLTDTYSTDKTFYYSCDERRNGQESKLKPNQLFHGGQ